MTKEKKIHYLVDYLGDFSIGKTNDELAMGDFVEINGAIYIVCDDSGEQRERHEVYLFHDLQMMLQQTRKSYWKKRLTDFLSDRSKFEIKKVTLIK
jgi:hypothetical protein